MDMSNINNICISSKVNTCSSQKNKNTDNTDKSDFINILQVVNNNKNSSDCNEKDNVILQSDNKEMASTLTKMLVLLMNLGQIYNDGSSSNIIKDSLNYGFNKYDCLNNEDIGYINLIGTNKNMDKEEIYNNLINLLSNANLNIDGTSLKENLVNQVSTDLTGVFNNDVSHSIALSDLLKNNSFVTEDNLQMNLGLFMNKLNEIIETKNLGNVKVEQINELVNQLRLESLSYLSGINSSVTSNNESTGLQLLNDSILYTGLRDAIVKDDAINELVLDSEIVKGTFKTEVQNDKISEQNSAINKNIGIINSDDSNNMATKFEVLNKVSDIDNYVKNDILDQVKEQITIMRDKNIDTVTMKLNPENLGKLDIKMLFKDGNVNVEITVSNSKIQHLLLSNLDEIKSILENNQEKVILNVNTEKELQHNYNDQNDGNQQNNRNSNQRENYTQDNYDQNDSGDIDFLDEFIKLRQVAI